MNLGSKSTGCVASNQLNKLLGVCNEHGPTPEGKMCSELRRNT